MLFMATSMKRRARPGPLTPDGHRRIVRWAASVRELHARHLIKGLVTLLPSTTTVVEILESVPVDRDVLAAVTA